MKSIGLVLGYLAGPARRRNLRLVGWLVAIQVVLVAVYSVIFHVLMAREGRDHSWATGVYWTLTVMSTLGFGDITFESDAGRLFSVVVLVSGALFILVLLPFAFIQFVFLPWVAYRDASRAPRALPAGTSGHMVLLGSGVVIDEVVQRATDTGMPYVLVEPDTTRALALHDEGVKVVVGDLDDPETYRAVRVDAAALVATTHVDTTSTNIVFTAREISDTVPIVATVSADVSVDILELAGADTVLQLGSMLGEAVARRVAGRDGRTQVIGAFDDLVVAEAAAVHPDLVGRPLLESGVRTRCGVDVVGVWAKGRFRPAAADSVPADGAVLVLAGTEAQLAAYDEAYGVDDGERGHVVVIGAGRVGRAAGAALGRDGFPHHIIEKRAERVRDDPVYVHGDAADVGVLDAAGLDDAVAVLITTHDDDVNVYLTIYCRRLRPDVQIIARSNLERNVATLTRAGADAVLSYASLGASAIWNVLGRNDTLVVAEGLEVFRVPVPASLAGTPLATSGIRERTGCTVVGIAHGDAISHEPDPTTPLAAGAGLVLIGDDEAQQRFHDRFPTTTWTT